MDAIYWADLEPHAVTLGIGAVDLGQGFKPVVKRKRQDSTAIGPWGQSVVSRDPALCGGRWNAASALQWCRALNSIRRFRHRPSLYRVGTRRAVLTNHTKVPRLSLSGDRNERLAHLQRRVHVSSRRRQEEKDAPFLWCPSALCRYSRCCLVLEVEDGRRFDCMLA